MTDHTNDTNWSFSVALNALKAGHRVRRTGWNGKGMWIVLVPGSKGLTVDEGRPLAKAGVQVGTVFNYLPHIDMWTAQGDLVPWLASQTDVLAEDWEVTDGAAATVNPPGRQTSPEIASLAGEYLSLTDEKLEFLFLNEPMGGARHKVMADLRKLAASALGQVNE